MHERHAEKQAWPSSSQVVVRRPYLIAVTRDSTITERPAYTGTIQSCRWRRRCQRQAAHIDDEMSACQRDWQQSHERTMHRDCWGCAPRVAALVRGAEDSRSRNGAASERSMGGGGFSPPANSEHATTLSVMSPSVFSLCACCFIYGRPICIISSPLNFFAFNFLACVCVCVCSF